MAEQVDEVTALAEQAPAALLGIVKPVIRRERSRVHARRQHARPALSKRTLHALDERREAAVEAHHQDAVR
jgi:hypothetical protein